MELSGLPPSAASYPAAPLTVELGHPVAIQIFVPPTAPAGTDTLSLGNGPHQVVVEAVDVDGRTATFRRTQLLVSN